ncbi:MAG: alpha/beta hydrolase [Acidaminococcales bacterium]|jgi:pimeloyl-ACP methyl ester carboxylesterase|nr:alpha/beta hydrolase [Acidaminococcales bacterium]
MAITGHYVNIGGIKTYYETNGGPPPKSILCIHTAGRENRQYHGLMTILENKYRLVAPDLPAHGKSWPLAGNKAIVDIEEYSAFIWEFAETLGMRDAVIMGCSLGGNVVYKLAIDYPVKAIISLQGASYTPSISEVARALMDHPHVSLQHSHIDFSDSLIGKDTADKEREFIIWGVRQEISTTKKADLTLYNGFDVRGEMGKVTCPVLVFRGEDDWIVDANSVNSTVAALTGAKKVTFRTFPGIGHFPAVERPEVVAKVVEEFMDAL